MMNATLPEWKKNVSVSKKYAKAAQLRNFPYGSRQKKILAKVDN